MPSFYVEKKFVVTQSLTGWFWRQISNDLESGQPRINNIQIIIGMRAIQLQRDRKVLVSRCFGLAASEYFRVAGHLTLTLTFLWSIQ